MPTWQTAHVHSTRTDFTALVVAATNLVDTLPGLDVLMVAGPGDGRRAYGRVALDGIVRGDGWQCSQRHGYECGA